MGFSGDVGYEFSLGNKGPESEYSGSRYVLMHTQGCDLSLDKFVTLNSSTDKATWYKTT